MSEDQFEHWYKCLIKHLSHRDVQEKEFWRIFFDLGLSEKEAINIGTEKIV